MEANANNFTNAPALLSELLEGIEHRGRDATGISWWGKSGRDATDEPWPIMVKGPIAATQFVMDYRDYLFTAAQSGLVIGHTRFPTQGDKKHNENNHPIDNGMIVGVHNGCIYNDDEIFRDLGTKAKRLAEVDSEAIFALLSTVAIEHQPGDERVTAMAKALEDLTGSMAIAFYAKDEPNVLYLARGASSPLFVSASPEADMVFASTATCITDAIDHMPNKRSFSKPQSVDEGTFMRFEAGVMTHSVSFEPCGPPRKVSYYQNTFWDDVRPPYTTPTEPIAFPHSVMDRTVFSKPGVWECTELPDHEWDLLTESAAWRLLSDNDVSFWTGMYSIEEQQTQLHDALPNAFLYPPVNADRVIDYANKQSFLRGAIASFTGRLLDKKDKRSTEALRNAAYRDLASVVTYDRVRCRVRNNWVDGWFVAHTDIGVYPSTRVIVAVPEAQQVTLRMMPQWDVKPYADRPSGEHSDRLDYVETLAIEHAYCHKHERPVLWPYLDYVTMPEVMWTRATQMVEVI